MKVILRIAAIAGMSCLGIRLGSAASIELPVRTQGGLVAGVLAANGTQAFKGIPFAAAPVGDLRWRAPQKPESWAGTRKADTFALACAQGALRQNVEPPANSEDCLYLNLWTPAASSAARLPVLVWIYGGGFRAGYAGDMRFDGGNLARQGVVLVTFGYRVGPLGFLVHPELTKESAHHASGNYGILDQIAALAWIKRNITAFGGDPGNVTIFGQSAGSTAVNILQASPLAKGLFRRVIGESTSQMDAATGLPGLQSFPQAEQAGLAFQAEMGSHSLAELRALPASRLTATTMEFWPVEPDGYVLPIDVYTAFKTGRQNPADVLVGANAAEGAILRQNWIKPTTSERAEFVQLYGEEKGPVRQSDTDTVLWQMWSWADLNANAAGRSYLYWFTRSPPLFPKQPWHLPGPVHGAEIPYVFFNLVPADAAWTATDNKVAVDMSTYWTNFARTGNPNGPGLPAWSVYEATNPNVLEFSATPAQIPMPRAAEIKFIDGYFAARRSQQARSPSIAAA